MKLEHGYNIPVLTSLKGHKLRELKDKAVFDLKFDKGNGNDEPAVDLYINSWLEDKNAGCPPTWNNFLVLLKDIKLGALAENILKIISPGSPMSDFSISPGIYIYIIHVIVNARQPGNYGR